MTYSSILILYFKDKILSISLHILTFKYFLILIFNFINNHIISYPLALFYANSL